MIVGSRQWAVGSGQCRLDNHHLATKRRLLHNQQLTAYCLLPTADYRLATDSGVILIALLWILTALSVIALSFARESFVEVAAARNAQSLESSYFVARAGITATVYRLMQRLYSPPARGTAPQDTPDPLDLGIVTGNFGGGVYRIDVQDESGKINVNLISEPQLRALVEASGIGKPDADIITDSILDWRDVDGAHRLNGAEDDYYQTLNPPYKARNGQIETIEELLLVRGMTTDYFYGHPERAPDGSVVYKYGLSRYLSAYGTPIQVNVNFAPLPVLLSIPGMSPQTAQMIYDRRRVKPFRNMEEVTREIQAPLGASIQSLLTTTQTGFYTLTASARAENSKARRVIRTVISLNQGARMPYQTLYWNENVPDYEGVSP